MYCVLQTTASKLVYLGRRWNYVGATAVEEDSEKTLLVLEYRYHKKLALTPF